MPDAAPDLTVPDPTPAGHPPGEPDELGGPGPDVPMALPGDPWTEEPVLGPPTVDSDDDGVPDTTVADVADQLVLATDLDHDGRADAVTRIGPEGIVTTPGGERLDPPWDAPPPPPPSVDPRTGEWIRG